VYFMQNFDILCDRPKRQTDTEIYRTHRSLRKPENMVAVFKLLLLWERLGTELFSKLFYPLQIASAYMVIICSVALIEYGHVMGWKMWILLGSITIVSNAIWLVVLHCCGMTPTVSRKCITSWKQFHWNPRDKKYMHRASKGCRPWRVSASGFYIVTFFRLLKHLNFLTWGIIRGCIFVRSNF